MKTIKKLAVILLIPAVYYIVLSGFSSKGSSSGYPVNPPPDPEQRNFINGILNNGPNTNPNKWITGQLSMYKGALNFNTIHSYDEIGGSGYHQNGTNNYGWFDEELQGFQKTNITNLTNSISEGEHLNFIYERSKISKLCYGQRLVYEVSSGGSTTLNNGFCYAHCDGEYTTDQNRTVLHLCPNPQQCNEGDATPRDIAWGIYENLQFGDLPFWNVQLADAGTWFVKPMMKIPLGTPDNVDVVRIDIYNYNGNNTNPPTPIKSITIKAKNFNVKGSYTENYTFSVGEPNLEITGGDGKSINNPPQLNDGQQIDYWKDWDANCKIDFKVHWLGQVEVWFDKMTVDDQIANELLSTDRCGNFDDKILEMATSENFLYIVDIVKQRKFGHENIEPINYILNIMYQKLRNQAIPITLK